MGIVSGHGEAYSGSPQGFFVSGDGETGKEATGWDLETGRVQERSLVSKESVHMGINRQAPSDGGTVGGPPDHIRILCAGDRVRGWGKEAVPVVVVDGCVCPTEGYSKDILADTRERKRQESGMCCGRGDQKVVDNGE